MWLLLAAKLNSLVTHNYSCFVFIQLKRFDILVFSFYTINKIILLLFLLNQVPVFLGLFLLVCLASSHPDVENDDGIKHEVLEEWNYNDFYKFNIEPDYGDTLVEVHYV